MCVCVPLTLSSLLDIYIYMISRWTYRHKDTYIDIHIHTNIHIYIYLYKNAPFAVRQSDADRWRRQISDF